jgi:hypothetical protein
VRSLLFLLIAFLLALLFLLLLLLLFLQVELFQTHLDGQLFKLFLGGLVGDVGFGLGITRRLGLCDWLSRCLGSCSLAFLETHANGSCQFRIFFFDVADSAWVSSLSSDDGAANDPITKVLSGPNNDTMGVVLILKGSNEGFHLGDLFFAAISEADDIYGHSVLLQFLGKNLQSFDIL